MKDSMYVKLLIIVKMFSTLILGTGFGIQIYSSITHADKINSFIGPALMLIYFIINGFLHFFNYNEKLNKIINRLDDKDKQMEKSV